jgi:hypothetical protein
MTWYVTWLTNNGVAYEEARHETDAARRAKELIDTGRATKATYFETNGLEASA